MLTDHDVIALNRSAVRTSIEVVDHVTAEDLARPTPCSEWTLADLLAHMTAQHRGFAAAAAGNGGDLAAWEVRPLAPDPVADYTGAALGVLAAFGADGVLSGEFELPEFGPGARVPAAPAIGFHLVDYVVHGWDVARSLGIGYRPETAVTDRALDIALAVPDGENRLAPGSPFAPGRAAAPDAASLECVLAALGRSPGWPVA